MNKTILVVVEDEDLRKAVSRVLTANAKDEITVVGVAGRTEAIAAMEAEPKRFNLVVTESGYPATFKHFTGTIRHINANARIILYADDDSADELSGLAHATVIRLEENAGATMRQKVKQLLAA